MLYYLFYFLLHLVWVQKVLYKNLKINVHFQGLVRFYGTSIIVGYLMPKLRWLSKIYVCVFVGRQSFN